MKNKRAYHQDDSIIKHRPTEKRSYTDFQESSIPKIPIQVSRGIIYTLNRNSYKNSQRKQYFFNIYLFC